MGVHCKGGLGTLHQLHLQTTYEVTVAKLGHPPLVPVHSALPLQHTELPLYK